VEPEGEHVQQVQEAHQPTPLAFAPRATRRPAGKPGIGKGRRVPVDKKLDKVLPELEKSEGQDKFRAIMEMKNQERSKRAADEVNESEAKRSKQD
jgi:hypothetical protein